MDKLYIWAAVELAGGAKIVLLLCQEGKTCCLGVSLKMVQLDWQVHLSFKSKQEKMLLGKGILIWKFKCSLFNTL